MWYMRAAREAQKGLGCVREISVSYVRTVSTNAPAAVKAQKCPGRLLVSYMPLAWSSSDTAKRVLGRLKQRLLRPKRGLKP